MNTSFYNGVIGTKTYQYGMDVIGNNIANVNTVGYKSSDVEFSTIFSQTISESASLPTSNQIGLGSRVSATTLDLSQGALQTSDNKFDLAIAGDGWFAIKYDNDIFYTRNGSMTLDASEYLTDSNGGYLLGVNANSIITTVNPDGTKSYQATLVDTIPLTSQSPVDKIFLPQNLSIPAQPTTQVSIKGNLDSTAIIDVVNLTVDPNQYTLTTTDNNASIEGIISPTQEILDPKPGDTIFVTLTNAEGKSKTVQTTLDENLQWSLQNIDISNLDPQNSGPIKEEVTLLTSQEIANKANFTTPIILPNGTKGVLDMTFTKHIPQSTNGSVWDAEIKLKEGDNIIDTTTGVLTFNELGALVSNTIGTLDNQGVPINLSLGTPYDPNIPNSGFNGLTSMNNIGTKLTEEEHDGFMAGELNDYIVGDNGYIYANFSNGKSTAIAQIPVYHFQNDQGLEKKGSNYFQNTSNSGEAFLYTDANGNVIQTSQIRSYTLEGSNVELSTALTEMIVIQKAFEANAKSITTSDQMIQQAINMKK